MICDAAPPEKRCRRRTAEDFDKRWHKGLYPTFVSEFLDEHQRKGLYGKEVFERISTAYNRIQDTTAFDALEERVRTKFHARHNPDRRCPHNRRKKWWKDGNKDCKALGIGGRRICQHGRTKHRCKDCKVLGSKQAKEFQRAYDMLQARKALGFGGVSICQHNRQKSKCTDCKALSIGGMGIC